MAYEKTIWKNREVERPRTFEKVENPDGTITLVPAEGNIIEPGTPIIAENMNKIEQGIQDAHDEIDEHKADNFHHIPYVIATGTNSYAVNIQGITALTEGMSIKVKFQNANTGTATLNINGLGAKAIKKSNGNDLSAGNIKAGQILHLVYTGSVFQLLGEGGEYGTAQPEHVLEGYTIGTEEGIKSGTMPNRGAINQTLTTQGGSYIIPKGYHDGSGIVKAQFANLVASNIKKGVNIGGVVGTLVQGLVLTPGTILVYDTQNLGSTTSTSWVHAYGRSFTANFDFTANIEIDTRVSYNNGYVRVEITRGGSVVYTRDATVTPAEGRVTKSMGSWSFQAGDIVKAYYRTQNGSGDVYLYGIHFLTNTNTSLFTW